MFLLECVHLDGVTEGLALQPLVREILRISDVEGACVTWRCTREMFGKLGQSAGPANLHQDVIHVHRLRRLSRSVSRRLGYAIQRYLGEIARLQRPPFDRGERGRLLAQVAER